MVYHIPGQEPLGNSGWLGPLRVFTCDEAAAQFAQRAVLKLARAVLVCSAALRMSEPRFPDAVVRVLTTVHGAGDARASMFPSRQTILVSAAAALATALMESLTTWRRHMQPVAPNSDKFFWHTDVGGNAPPAAHGILFYAKPANLPPNATPADVRTVMINKKWNRWYTWPMRLQDPPHIRAFNVMGLKLLPYLAIDLTKGFENPMTSLCRVIQRYCWVPKWNKPKADRRKMYQAVMNTSYTCFIDFEVGSETFGHAVLDDIILPYAQTSIKAFSRMIIHLDHEREVVTKVRLFSQDNDKAPTVETYGSEIDGENTYTTDPELTKDGITITPLQNLEQAAMLMIVVISLYNHGLVRGWASGTAYLPDGVWSQRDASTNITNYTNAKAVAEMQRFLGGGVTLETVGRICEHNVMQGVPNPSTIPGASDALMKLVASRSKFHQMTMSARIRLYEHFNIICNCNGTYLPAIEAIAAATVMNSAEHYYTWRHLPLIGPSGSVMALKTDISGLALSLQPRTAAAWTGSSDLCKHHLLDPVCRMVHSACSAVDAEFADVALFIGCVN